MACKARNNNCTCTWQLNLKSCKPYYVTFRLKSFEMRELLLVENETFFWIPFWVCCHRWVQWLKTRVCARATRNYQPLICPPLNSVRALMSPWRHKQISRMITTIDLYREVSRDVTSLSPPPCWVHVLKYRSCDGEIVPNMAVKMTS